MDAAVRRMTSKKSSKTPDIAKASAKPNDTLERGACCDDHGPGDRNSAVEPEPAECTKRLRDNAWLVKDRPGAKRARHLKENDDVGLECHEMGIYCHETIDQW